MISLASVLGLDLLWKAYCFCALKVESWQVKFTAKIIALYFIAEDIAFGFYRAGDLLWAKNQQKSNKQYRKWTAAQQQKWFEFKSIRNPVISGAAPLWKPQCFACQKFGDLFCSVSGLGNKNDVNAQLQLQIPKSFCLHPLVGLDSLWKPFCFVCWRLGICFVTFQSWGTEWD